VEQKKKLINMAFMKSMTLGPRLSLSRFLPNIDYSYSLVCSVIAIHGLNGHWKDTWTDVSTSTFWLKDLLPSAIPDTRIISYGYDADTHGDHPVSKETIDGHARTFISQLVAQRKFTGVSPFDSWRLLTIGVTNWILLCRRQNAPSSSLPIAWEALF
jgi:hypothetical protein